MKDLKELTKEIIEKSFEIARASYPGYEFKIGLITIFTHSNEEYEFYKDDLSKYINGEGVNNGILFSFNKGLKIGEYLVNKIRVRKPDIHRPEIGDLDFEYDVSKYEELKQKALQVGHYIFFKKNCEYIQILDKGVNVIGCITKYY